MKIALISGLVVFSATFSQAQSRPPVPIPPPPGAQNKTYTLKRAVDMVRLPVSITDKKGNFISGLQQQNFRVSENGVPQKIAQFSNADIPIAVGLVIDNSGSMKPKRQRVNAAAMMFVKTSNPQDQVFVVNFNDEYYLDMDTDFTNDAGVLRAALARIDSRGGTALYDAILGSMNHMKKAAREKHVLLVVTDGEDQDSTHSLSYTVEKLQQTNVVIYAVGLFSSPDDSGAEKRRGKKALEALTQATGGEAFFPKTVEQVDSICTRIAQDIRDQYMIGYYPTDTAKDGTFRTVKVELTDIHHHGKLTLRARPGYYAPKASAGGESADSAN